MNKRLVTFAKGRAEVMVYGDIGAGFWSEGVTANAIAEELKALGAVDGLDVRINSYGGDVFEGVAIHRLLTDFPARKTVHIDGIAASAASVIAMCGDTVRMAEAGQLMIHDAWTIVAGNAAQLRSAADRVELTSQQLAKVYAQRSGRAEVEVRDWMRANAGDGTWFSAERAKEVGLADEIAPNVKLGVGVDETTARAHAKDPAILALPTFDATRHGVTPPPELAPDRMAARLSTFRMKARLVASGR